VARSWRDAPFRVLSMCSVGMMQSMAETLYDAVMPRGANQAVLAEVAEDQWGLLTRRQAEGDRYCLDDSCPHGQG
jgi:hypothetical protein